MKIDCDNNGNVTITFNAKEGAANAQPSKSGKTKIVATTGGAIAVRVPGVAELVKVSVNAYQ